MSYLASYLIFSLKICLKTQFKPIENYHVENVILGKDLNLDMIGCLFHGFTPMGFHPTHHHIILGLNDL
jgi:hypothetical protein